MLFYYTSCIRYNYDYPRSDLVSDSDKDHNEIWKYKMLYKKLYNFLNFHGHYESFGF